MKEIVMVERTEEMKKTTVDFYDDFAKKYWHTLNYGQCAANFADGDSSWVYKSYVFNPKIKQGSIFEHKNLKDLAE